MRSAILALVLGVAALGTAATPSTAEANPIAAQPSCVGTVAWHRGFYRHPGYRGYWHGGHYWYRGYYRYRGC